MDAFKIAVKLFAVRDGFAPDAFIPVFHSWIQNQSLPGHLLIDVADYAHVVNGPGTVLVASEANLYLERGEGRLGLLYSRKLPFSPPGTFGERLRAVLRETLKAAEKLESDPALAGKLTFRSDEILIRLNDRLNAPNNEQTFAAVKSDVQAIATELFGGKPAKLEPHITPHTLFEIRIKSSDSPEPISKLLGRLIGK
jgi:hypothetical protein